MHLRYRYALALALVVGSAAPGRTQEPNLAPSQERKQVDSTDGTIRVNVNRVPVGVTVTDARGYFIKGLRREDFQIFDDGVERPITAFASNETPASLVLVIECGTSSYLMAKMSRSIFAGAETLLTSINPADRVAIVTYSQQPQLVFDFTADKAATQAALRRLNSQLLNAKSGGGWLNLSSSLAATLDWLAPIPGNKTLVLFSSGIDTSPVETWGSLGEKINTADVRILAVSAFGDLRKPAKVKRLTRDDRTERAWVKQVIAESDQALHQIAAATGGHIYLPRSAKEFAHAYHEIGLLVRGEYSLEFVPPAADGRVHAIHVQVKGSAYRVDHRQAYRAPAPHPN